MKINTSMESGIATGNGNGLTTEDLTGQSHWWGFPDLPEALEWPCSNDGELLTFICQIRLDDIAGYDSAGILP